jgi:hypothetical protein
MPQAYEFWRYAQEAMLRAHQSKVEKEKRALLELARTWTLAALRREGTVAINDAAPKAPEPFKIASLVGERHR